MMHELEGYDEKLNNKALGFMTLILMMRLRLIMGSLRGWLRGYEKVSSLLTQTISGTTDTLLIVEIYKNMTKINSEEI